MVSKAALSAMMFLALLATIGVAQAAVGDGACYDYGTVQKTNCGSTPSSTYHMGAVELCGDCFACGFKDGVCPWDFGADCGWCADEDCLITVNGTVTSPSGNPLQGAEVIAYQPHFVDTYITSTDDSGFYEFTIPRGDYDLRIRHDEFPYQQIKIPQEPGPITVDVPMTNPTCTSTCMTWTETGMRCQSICRGDNSCYPDTPPYAADATITTDLLDKCDEQGAEANTVVYLATIDENTQLWGTCCSGPVFTTNWKQSIEPQSDARDITKRIIPGTYKNDTRTIPGIKVHIITYKE